MNNLSQSILLNKYENIWQLDSSNDVCSNCKSYFNLFIRRHHCRSCGKIYCSYCLSKNNILIPKYIELPKNIPIYININNPTIVCILCYNKIKSLIELEKLSNILNLLNLTIKEWKNIASVSKLCHIISKLKLNNFYNLQYKLFSTDYTNEDINNLYNNRNYLHGHSLYYSHLINTFPNYFDESHITHRHIPCSYLHCSRNCNKQIFILPLLKKQNKLLRIYIVNNLKKYDMNIIKNISIYLLYVLLQNSIFDITKQDNMLVNFIIDICKNNIFILNKVYHYLCIYDNNTELNKKKIVLSAIILNKIDDDISEKLRLSDNFINEIKDGNFNINKKYICPLYLDKKDLKITEIKIIESATNPIFVKMDNDISFIYKVDNLLQDMVVLDIISLMKKHLIDDLGDVFNNIITYDVLPFSNTYGYINPIKKSETLYHIKEKKKMSLLNYILDNNPNVNSDNIRNKFIISCATYSVITHILSIGDRHLDNIMITDDGNFFHIDYGFSFGQNPLLNSTSVRLTEEMIDVLGGKNSKSYEKFIYESNRIYTCLRKYSHEYLSLVSILLGDENNKSYNLSIINNISNNLMIGKASEYAENHIIDRLSERSYTYYIIDFFHYHSKEKTIINIASDFINVISDLWGADYNIF